MTARTYYTDDLERGFVVRSAITYPPDGEYPYPSGGTHHSWWYGPTRGFGTTWGGLDFSVAVFPSRVAAERAIASYAGAPANPAAGRRHHVETVKEARALRDRLARAREEASS